MLQYKPPQLDLRDVRIETVREIYGAVREDLMHRRHHAINVDTARRDSAKARQVLRILYEIPNSELSCCRDPKISPEERAVKTRELLLRDIASILEQQGSP